MSFIISFPLLARKSETFPIFLSSLSNMVALPKLTKEGYRILSYRLTDFNPSHIIFGDGVKVINN
jgi:hypothetical protein